MSARTKRFQAPFMFLGSSVPATCLPPPKVSLHFLLLSALTKQRIQPIKDAAALLEQLAIITQHLAQAVDDCIEARRFKTVKLVIFQIDVMHYFGNFAQGSAVTQAEPLQHRLEGAILTVMRELSAEHIERNRALHRLAVHNKIEARTFVDELS